ncbi:MAG: HD domain-containing protein [Gammaproteobacteria bacterium]|nr:HD domain-containing protein [Gammaproteobacteria bacterium]
MDKSNQSNFKKKAAIRITLISIFLAVITGLLGWYVTIEKFEDSIVNMGTEEAQRLISHHNHLQDKYGDINKSMNEAARSLIGGLFDIAEIYNTDGVKLAEALTSAGEKIEHVIPSHSRNNFDDKPYESFHLPTGEWVLRIFVPLLEIEDNNHQQNLGYFEGVRIIPDWQDEQIHENSLLVSIIAIFASLFCGFLIYPIVVNLSNENEKKTLEVLDSHISMMEALGRAIAKRDSDTGIHNYRVAWIAAKIAETVGVKGSEMQSLIAGSFLHDVGKIGIKDEILLKPGKLDENEFEIMKTHVSQGEDIVKGLGWLNGANEIVSAHHEKFNGRGYPRGLKGEQIPLAARIFAIADVFDALSSKRPYKEPMPFEQVMEILEQDSGTHFDHELMEVFKPLAQEVANKLKNLNEESARALLEKMILKHFYINK